jgi:FKBP-type peptidyl-prolyl cis-trans isomerase SlpA
MSVKVVQDNSTLKIRFSLTLLDGTWVEGTQGDETFYFTLGDGTFIHTLEEMLIGLEAGTTAKLTLSPDAAFGLADSQNVVTMNRADFADYADEEALKVGSVIGFDTPTGQEVPGRIESISETEVVVDFNHPLADTVVVFEVTIVAID